jgi:CheY-like chemotaxis protein
LDRPTLADYSGSEDLLPGQYVMLEVSDDGCGMTAETMTRIFEPFFTTKFTGRGLGLAAVLGIVRGHKGAIQVQSRLGQGTTFRLALPAAGPATGDTKFARRATMPAWRGHGTVLVIDDEEAVRMVASKMLQSLGFEVLTAEDGEEGVHLYRVHQPELRAVLCDLTMPKKDGEETFREIRALDQEACVVLMSGFNEQEAAARFVGLGLAGFLQKPFTTEELRERIASFLKPEVKA